ncbi:MAG: UDP-3-O-[3-hydroxymyristoyl] N-acetylglucosamine deacetylase [Planctomycetes bacterium]|nr:UDP-3-O-[3-hydroxymyristoyl] N-acetylglucosamine deacetylase [Planctomycetota bacterium]
MSTNQNTVAAAFTLEGKGLHTGKDAKVTVHPGEADSGFILRVEGKEFPVSPMIGDGSKHRTVMIDGETEVHTVEHLLAAVHGLGVDNAVIEVEGGEIPGTDGSGKVFADKVREVGLAEQDKPVKSFKLKKPITASFDKSSITAFPTKDGSFRITYILDYPESKLAQGTAEFVIDPETVEKNIIPCRTFVMKCHAEAMLQAGMGQGASTENTVVLDGETVVDNELRFEDECVRHKVLDVIGDLATLGVRLGAHIVAYKSGHALNLELAKLLASEINREEYPRGVMDIRKIEDTLPHRYPFLMVDRVVELDPLKKIKAYKNITRNEPYFNGHFPGQPIMPGVLQVEALAQTACLALLGQKGYEGKLAVLMGVDGVKYRRPVVPGDKLEMVATLLKLRGRIGVVNAVASVDGDVSTECEIKFALVDPEEYT